MVNVRWADDIDGAERGSLESEFHLTNGRHKEGSVWVYDLADVSRRNLEAIVDHPRIADTHHINRADHTLAATAERTEPRGGFISRDGPAATLLETAFVLTACAFALALIVTGLLATNRVAADPIETLRPLGGSLASWLQRGIPELDARAAGAFRVAFAVPLVVFLALNRVDSTWLANPATVQKTGALHGWIVDALAAFPRAVDAVWPVALAAGATFAAGFVTRASFPVFVTAFALWAATYMAHRGIHTTSAVMLALVALLPARWGDRGAHGEVSRAYGYAPWACVLVLGVCFAAAAWSKVKDGPEWVLNGTVGYHFITDSPQAITNAGLYVARSPALAVMASAVAVAVELLVITAVFTRGAAYRLVLGGAAMALLAGFGVLQGVWWPTWWILLLGFLPWQRWSRAQPVGARAFVGPARPAQLVMAAVIVLQQVLTSAAGTEQAPFFSEYEMYSATFASREEFDRTRPSSYRLSGSMVDGSEIRCVISEDTGEVLQSAEREGGVDPALIASALESCGLEGSRVRHLTLDARQQVFDWTHGTFSERQAHTTIPMPRR